MFYGGFPILLASGFPNRFVGAAPAAGGVFGVDSLMTTCTHFLTYEQKRKRFVFQIRIPADLRANFNERTTVRKSLGNIPRETAEAHAHDLAAQYQSEFTRCRLVPVQNQRSPIIELNVTANTGRQLAATWQRQAVNDLTAQLARLKDAPTEAWEGALACAQAELAVGKELLRRGDISDFEAVLASLEHKYGFILRGEANALADVGRQFNASRVAYLTTTLQVLSGSLGIDDVTPASSDQLPLVSLWGTPAADLPERWATGKRSIGLEPNLKTLDKYKLIARDFAAVLNGRPVEDLCENDLSAIKARWSVQGNGPSTVVCKLDLLKQLVRLLGRREDIERCFQAARPVGGKLKTKRLPFTREQVCTWISAVNADRNLPEDDKMLVHLLLLTAARLEELCQLSADDVSIDHDFWQLRIARGQDTGSDAKIKNSASARRLMIPMGVLPDLDTWLNERIAATGRIFPNLGVNKYGELGGAVSKRLNKLLRRVLGPDRRLVLLSSRPTGNRVMRRAGIDPRVRHRQLGHADQGIHDQHYDAAEHFDDEDLLPGATILAEWLADCIGAEAAPKRNGEILGNDSGMSEFDTNVRNESNQPTGTVHDTPIQSQNLFLGLRLAQSGVVFADLSEQTHTTPIKVGNILTNTRTHNDTSRELGQEDINGRSSPSRCALPGLQVHINLERHSGELEQACNNELQRGSDGSPCSRIAANRAMGNLASNVVDQTQAERRLKSLSVDITPHFKASGITAALKKESKIIREDSPLRGELQKSDDRIDPASFPQVVAGIRESLPEILNGLNSGVEENSHEIGQGHCFKEILDADGRPAQKFGNLTTLIGV